jgi:hypothetical protein
MFLAAMRSNSLKHLQQVFFSLGNEVRIHKEIRGNLSSTTATTTLAVMIGSLAASNNSD